MENDDKIFQNVFKLDYAQQNIINNKQFENWKSEIKTQYDESIRLYKCNKDNIYFYAKIHNSLDEYLAKCPECNEYICCFCSRVIKEKYLYYTFIDKYCCLKRLIYYIFNREKDTEKDMKKEAKNGKEGKGDFPICIYIVMYIGYIIPIINNFFFILFFILNLFCLRNPTSKEYLNYKDFLEDNNFIYITMSIIILGFSITMAIPYAIFSLTYIIILFLISIPFKMRPLNNYILFILEGLGDII